MLRCLFDPRRRARSAAALAAAAFALGGEAAIPTAHASALRPLGTAVVSSVDGPGLLTIAVGRRRLATRLFFIDVPRDGECGAAETTTALSGFVRRAPRRFSYALLKNRAGFERAADGRLVTVLAYRSRHGWRDLGNDLLDVGWGRSGDPATEVDAAPVHGTFPSGTRKADDSGADRAVHRRLGVWARCGGRVHLPLGQAVPTTSAPIWIVDEFGVATSIGPLSLSPTLTPASSLTLGRLAGTAPVEYTRGLFGCVATVPSLQLEALASGQDAACGSAPVLYLHPAGPDPVRLSRGGGVGLPIGQLRAGYPRFDLDDPAGWLSGMRRQWAWQVFAETGDSGAVVTDLGTYQPPSVPDD